MSKRCEWVGTDPISIKYHDEEWGVPLHEDHKLFEFLVLDAMQAGLSWLIVLKKRDNFREAFDHYDLHKISKYGEDKIEELLNNPGIIRNRRKIEATIQNAQAFLHIQEEYGTFDAYIWQFVEGTPRINAWKRLEDLPANTAQSDAMSQDLRGRSFKFVGSTICYAFMQAAGMVNDHTVDCFRYMEIQED
jgi:DNA-3-methyladenine glycosylase I